MQPAGEVARLKRVERTEHADEDVLRQVFGILPIAGQAVGKAIDPSRVFGHDRSPVVRIAPKVRRAKAPKEVLK